MWYEFGVIVFRNLCLVITYSWEYIMYIYTIMKVVGYLDYIGAGIMNSEV